MDGYAFVEPSSSIPGIIATSIAGFISLFAVLGLLAYMVYRHVCRTAAEKTGQQSTMGDKHMTAYFYSLLAASFVKAMSVVMNVRWTYMPMEAGAFCTAQAALKLAGNVGTGIWSMVIAMHIFNLLFLSLRPIKWSLPAVVGGVWSIILADMLIGPAAFRDFFTPYDGGDGDGTSCWISDHHPGARFMLEYFPTGLTPFVSILLLTVTLLYLRGNIVYVNGRVKLRLRLHGDDAWHNEQMRDALDRSILATVQRMIWFPISYFLLWTPVMISRLMQFSHDRQSFGFVAFALFTYALTGFADVVLFVLTRHVVLKDGAVAPAYADLEKERTAQQGPHPGSGITLPPSPPGMKENKPSPGALPRPLVLQAIIDDAPLSRSSSSASSRSYHSSQSTKSTSALLTGPTIPSFTSRSPDAPLPPAPILGSRVMENRSLPPLIPVAAPSRMTDVSLITSSRPPETASTEFSMVPSSFSGDSGRRIAVRKAMGIGALQNGPKLSRNGSAGSQSSPSGSSFGPRRDRGSGASWPTNFMSIGSDAPRSGFSSPSTGARDQVLRVPPSVVPGTYTAQASILSAYGAERDNLTAPMTDIGSDESFVVGSPSTLAAPSVSSRLASMRGGSGETFGAAVKAAGKHVVAPVTSDETFKAKLYGTRFSLVAGPTPAYNYDRPA